MRTNLIVNPVHRDEPAWPLRGILYRLRPVDPGADGDTDEPSPDAETAGHGDLPFKVELWDAAKASVERVLAVTAHGSIGYAAFYAATREYPDRYITLRHKDSIMSRWNGPQH